jgi:succinate-semialdehyde dehydrogenase/glutarate-semialdehyde dehydrogenase
MSLSVQTINPATEEILQEFKFQSDQEIEECVAAGAEAFEHWRKVPVATRLECVRVFAEGLRAGRQELGELMTNEMGKPIKDSLAEIDKCIASSLYLRENWPQWLKAKEYDIGNGYGVRYAPMGPLIGIMPWNFPLWQVVRFAVPALMAGNSILLKHAPNTWGSAEYMAEIFRQAFPDGVYQNLRVDVPVVDRLIADPRIRGVSLTGSRRAGMSVGRAAGGHLKKCVLELGGSDAYVVLDDADVALSAEVCAKSRLLNAGQSCVSAKRFIVTKKNIGEFTELMTANMAAVEGGNPLDTGTLMGPLARRDLRDQLHEQVERSLRGGAKAALGAELPSGKGYFYPSSVLTGVKPGVAAFDEELFGPVAAIVEARDESEAFKLANRSNYGLGGAIFSRDVERARELAHHELETGMIAINDFVRSDASAPFGGVKDSGLGRELGREGSFEFMEVKTIFVKPG